MKTLTISQLKIKKAKEKSSLIFIFPFLIGAFCTLLFSICNPAFALKNNNSSSGKVNPAPSPLSGCSPGTAMTDLDVNNVRARMCTGGDMWWDFAKQVGQYEVPKGSGIMPIYAGALWVGGMNSGNLYLAGQEYRSYGNDWWPGPLDTIGGAATVSPEVCQQYDQHYKITQAEVAAFVGGSGPATAAITNWPGNGNTSVGQAQYLAPFFDKDGNGKYEPSQGDYPGFDLVQGDNFGGNQVNNCVPVDQLFGDQCLWWVMNDKGNIHSETKGLPMGVEVHCQAFAFNTDDEINSMTFINYRIYNRSSLTLDSTFIGVWSDPDLGCATDDYVGCDVSRGLGYVYNGTNNDVACSGELGYGVNPPALGIDFFRGPIATPGDGKDNNHNCQVDEPCEQAIMTHFTYFTNGAPTGYGDPSIAKEYYNYLSGSWANGNPVYYGGLGYPSGGSTTIPAAYTFPGMSDQKYGWGLGGNCSSPVPGGGTNVNWTEVTAAATPGDRRFVESAGPFRLLPGAVNVVTAGVVFAKATAGGPQASVNLMLLADDKAQKLFDNSFQVLNGPDAPDLTIQELDKKLILYLTNKPSSNNYNENYLEYDPSISLADSMGKGLHCIDTTYHFEGYKIFQLKDATVSAGDLTNADKARLVAQCDVKNGVSTIVNYLFDATLGASIPTTEVAGSDKGIFHSLVVTTDLFAKGDPSLVNHKSYYFMALAYGYNKFKPYKQDGLVDIKDNICPLPTTVTPAMDGQKKPYKQGRKNLQNYSATPHIPTIYTGGTEMQGAYGDGPVITRIEGNGNGGMVLDFATATTNSILANGKMATPTYLSGRGPVAITVVDPLNVPEGQSFTLKFDNEPSIRYNPLSPLSPPFKVGERIKDSLAYNDTATAVVLDNNGTLMHLKTIVNGLNNRPFAYGEKIKGETSGATSNIILYGPGGIDNATWTLKNNSTSEVVYSDKTIKLINEQILDEQLLAPQFGLAISIAQPLNPGSQTSPNGFLEATSTGGKWLNSVAYNSASLYTTWLNAANLTTYDPDKKYAGILGGTWAPYALCEATPSSFTSPSNHPTATTNIYYAGPAWDASSMSLTKMSDLASVDVVLTSDKSKWTRCMVLEMCDDSGSTHVPFSYSQHLNGNGSRKFDKRSHYSVDKNGNTNPSGHVSYTNPDDPNYIDSIGMGWFPGYALNLETGERLNMAFGENSALSGGVFEQHGANMLWDPTDKVMDSVPYHCVSGKDTIGPVFGGQHYIYVFGHNKDASTFSINVPRYDAAKYMDSIFRLTGGHPSTPNKRSIVKDAMWVNLPLLATGHKLWESDVTIRLRVAKPYRSGYSIATDTTTTAQNKNMPMYTFGTDGIATQIKKHDLAVEALDLINVVPNPYYAFSTYEPNHLDNRIKITNLPEQCTVSIYNLGGTLIKRLKKGDLISKAAPVGSLDPNTHDGSLDWDLKNTAGTPISSGVYIIHVEVPGVGEKVVKWFGVMRPIDLGTF